MVVGMERFGATGGASSSPTKSGWDSADVKPYMHTDTRPTKSGWDSADVKPYKHTDPRPTKSGWDSAIFDG